MAALVKIDKKTFDTFSFDAAVVLSKFDPQGSQPVQEQDVICATTGDLSVSCVPRMVDLGADVNGCPPNLAELQRLTGWDCKVSFTALTATPAVLALALGAATVSETKVTGNAKIAPADFKDVWLVAERLDGGLVAAHLKKALSSAGLSLTTTKNGKGQLVVELTGHPSIEDADLLAAPIEFYSTAPGK